MTKSYNNFQLNRKHGCNTQLLFLIGQFTKKILKPLGQLEPNFAGMMFGKSSLKILILLPKHKNMQLLAMFSV
jgi:hypothetical protein